MKQMRPPCFPVTTEALPAKLAFLQMKKAPVRIGKAEVSCMRMNHPGGLCAYRTAFDFGHTSATMAVNLAILTAREGMEPAP